MDSTDIQQRLFNHIKGLVPPNIALVDVVADVLKISNDSVYRRIRGEKPISLDKVRILATHFKISIDQVLHLKTDAFLFSGRITNNSDFKYENWLENVVYLKSTQPNPQKSNKYHNYRNAFWVFAFCLQ